MRKRLDPLKMQYKKISEASLVVVLFILCASFMAFKRAETKTEIMTLEFKPTEVVEVPLTHQQERRQRPQMPTIPIESEDEDIPKDLTIDPMDINWSLAEAGPPPAPPEDDNEELGFVAYDTAPYIIGGEAALAANLVYPEIARKAGVEGKVIVNVLLDKAGKVLNTRVLKSLGNNGCDEAAIDAVKKVRWKPAYQRDEPVKVWVAVTVIFRLK